MIKKKYRLTHQFLHAYQIRFMKPIGSLKYLKDRMITCPLPKELDKYLTGYFWKT